MSNQFIDPSTYRSLTVLVESVTVPLLREHAAPICMELDIDTSLEVPANPEQTVQLIRSLVLQSIGEMPEGGDLTITACETDNGLELELADTGCDVESRGTRIPLFAAAIGARVHWQNCPQGGAAATILFPPQSESRRRAA